MDSVAGKYFKISKDLFQYRISQILIFSLILISAKANNLALSYIFSRVIILLSIFLFVYYGKKISNRFLYFTGGYLLFALIHFIKFNQTSVISDFLFFYVDRIFLVYLIIVVVGENFFKIYENIIYKLALISIPLYVCQLLFPSLFFDLNSILQDYILHQDYPSYYSNSVIFTFRSPHWLRNSGFSWEPGAFGAFITLALFIHLINSDFKIKGRFYLYMIVLITTFSTTGYLNMMIIMVFYILNLNKKHLKIILMFLFVVVILFVWQLDILGEKIQYQIFEIDSAIENLASGIMYTKERMYSLNRFASLVYELPYILDNIYIGMGLKADEILTFDNSFNLTNGLSNYTLKFGLTGLIFLLINLKLWINRFTIGLKIKGKWIFVLIICVISFSNPILFSPVFLSLQLYYYSLPSMKTFEF